MCILINSPVYTCFQGKSVSSFFGSRKREIKFVVFPTDGSSDSEEGTSDEDMEDELYTEGQVEDDSSGDLNGSSNDEAEERANQNKQEKRGTREFR